MTFAIADESENADLFSDFGFDESSEEVNVGIIGPKEKKYPMEPVGEFKLEKVVKFLKSFTKGRPMLALSFVYYCTCLASYSVALSRACLLILVACVYL